MERDVMPAICGRRNWEEEQWLRGVHLLDIDITGDGVTTSHFLNVGFELPHIFVHNVMNHIFPLFPSLVFSTIYYLFYLH